MILSSKKPDAFGGWSDFSKSGETMIYLSLRLPIITLEIGGGLCHNFVGDKLVVDNPR
jgi:hypothetical protein